MMVDYSSQQPGKRLGAHAETINPDDFSRFLSVSRSRDMDLILEIKDTEKSVCMALQIAAGDFRLYTE